MRKITHIIVIFFALLFIDCSKSITPDTQAILAAQRGNITIGDIEEEAQSYVEEITIILLRDTENDVEIINALQTYIDENGDDMRVNAQALKEKLNSLTSVTRRAYEQQLSEFFAETTFAWIDAQNAFLEIYPEQEEALYRAIRVEFYQK